jgi:hypothetical protein
MEEFGFFLFDKTNKVPIFKQKGVFRTNCLDCLDRTNVVQTSFARRILDLFQAKFGIRLGAFEFEAWNVAFNGLWADNGDWLSRIYAGTGALKSSYTRRGKQTVFGYLDDAAKSVNRFYVSNFQDKTRQEAILLLFNPAQKTNKLLVRSPAYDFVEKQMDARMAEVSNPTLILLMLLICVLYTVT